jgi:asparagine synthase (glutamine-hydrolysing)
MCGIVGCFTWERKIDLDSEQQSAILQTLKRRGPDETGVCCEDRVFLGHTRLSIIDLSTGSQPIYNEDLTKCIIFNGEVFNFHEIRAELEGLGHIFRSLTDTEVILHAYEQWGQRCLERFRGMFAFAIYDKQQESIFIARDRLGIKPLFYAFISGIFYFASEIKSLLRFPGFPKEMDTTALGAYFVLGYIPAPLTIFRHIRKMPAGHFMRVSASGTVLTKYWDLWYQPQRERSEEFFIKQLRNHVEESVRLRLVSDVPVGAFLSAGVDSSIILDTMSQISNDPVHTFCIGYSGTVGGFLDERPVARLTAQKNHAIHDEYEVTPDVGLIIDDIVGAFDEPFADSSTVPSYYLCEATRKKVKVALSGLGGDELFGGYERYLGFRLSRIFNLLPQSLRKNLLQRLVDSLPERADGHYTIDHLKRFTRFAAMAEDQRYLGFVKIMKRQEYEGVLTDRNIIHQGEEFCQGVFSDHFDSKNAEDPMDKMFYTDMKTYLPDDILACTDRVSMWHSLEVRVPFLDHKLVELSGTIPSDLKIRRLTKKYLLRKAYRNDLLDEVFEHRKQGFIGPMTMWLKKDMKNFVWDVLSEQNTRKHGLINTKILKDILTRHETRMENNEKLIWALIVFQVWHNKYMD